MDRIFVNFKKNRGKLLSLLVLCLYIMFIFLDFLRLSIAGCYRFYNFFIPYIAIIIVIITIISMKKYIVFYRMVIIFLLYISLVEIFHSNFTNFIVICENICWILIPLNIVIYLDKKNYFIVLIPFVLLNCMLSIPSFLNHFINLPVATQPGIIGVNDPGFYGQRNINGMINAIALFVSLFLLNKIKYKLYKYLLLVMMILNVLNICFSGSRSALLSIIITFGIYLISKIKEKRKIIFVGISTFVLTVIAIFARIKNKLLAEHGLMNILDVLTTYRNRVWIESIYLTLTLNFWFGCGVNTVYNNAYNFIGENSNIYQQGIEINNAHNLFINIFYNSGFIALVFFCIICYQFIKIILNKADLKSFNKSIFIVICGFVISMLDVPLLYTTSFINIIWWLFVFYTVSEA